MSLIEVMLDARELLGIYDIPDYAEAKLAEVMKFGVVGMEQYAKTHHRFQNRTGSLIQAISSATYGLSGRVYIDDMIAPYGVYVHQGQRSWAPDQFIYEAVDTLTADLKLELQQALAESLMEQRASMVEPSPAMKRYEKPDGPDPYKFTPRYKTVRPDKPVVIYKNAPPEKPKIKKPVSVAYNIETKKKPSGKYELSIRLFESLIAEEEKEAAKQSMLSRILGRFRRKKKK